jgi:hypothetical protein
MDADFNINLNARSAMKEVRRMYTAKNKYFLIKFADNTPEKQH